MTARCIVNDIATDLGLLVQTHFYADESLNGFLHRLAQSNGLPGRLVVGQFLSKLAESDEFRKKLAALQATWLDMAREMQNPPTRAMPIWNLRRRRFCNRCLAEGAYWRRTWDLSLVVVCTRHKLALCDACPHCGCELTWNSVVVDHCPQCCMTLLKVVEIQATQSEIWLCRKLMARLGNHRHESRSIFQHLDLQKFHDLVFRLGACAVRPNSPKPMQIAESVSLAIARPIALRGAKALQEWPRGLFKTFDRIRSMRNPENDWKLWAAFGPVYRAIFRDMAQPEFQFLREALEQYILEKWQAPIAFRHRRLSVDTVKAHRWLPPDEVAARLDLGVSIISRVAKAGSVGIRTCIYKTGRIAHAIDLLAVQKIGNSLRHAMTLKETADKFGITKDRTAKMIQEGLLKTWGGVPGSGAVWFVDADHVKEILAFSTRVPLVERITDTEVTMAHLLRYVLKDQNAFLTFVKAIIEHEISVIATASVKRRLCDWIFSSNEVKQLLTRCRSKSGDEILIVDVAKALGVKQEVAYSLVRQGVIVCEERRMGGRKVRIVLRTEVEKFQTRYVFSSELASRFGKSPRLILYTLIQAKIMPAGGPTIEGRVCRQYYWLRGKKLDDAVALLFA